MISITIFICGLFGFFSAVPESVLLAQADVTQTPAASDIAKSDNASPAPATGEAAVTPAKSKDGVATDDASADGTATEEAESGAEQTGGFWSSVDELLHSGAMGLMIEGGIFMWPILLMGIIAFAVIIERYRSLQMLGTDTQALRSQVRTLLEQEKVEEALKLCDGLQGPVPAILSAGLRKFLVLQRLDYDPGKIEEQVVKAMDDYGIHVVGAMEKHLPTLATVSSAAVSGRAFP